MAMAPASAKLSPHQIIGSQTIIVQVFKILIFLVALLPLECFAQFNISGRVLNHADKKPVADATVFLDNALVGNKTANDGTFELHNAQPGKYKLVVSIVGFETYSQTIQVSNSNIILNDIELTPKAIALKEVSIKPKKEDPDRKRNYEWFKTEFLGSSDLAGECKIKNPDVIDLDYDVKTNTLTASSYDFIEIENNVLGYRIKYLLSNFTLEKIDANTKKVHYEGSALFESLKGTITQERDWQKMRQAVYNNSSMHFLRALISNRLGEEGFRVLQYANYGKPKQHPALLDIPLQQKDIMEPTEHKGIYSLGCAGDALHITYNKDHHFPKNGQTAHLDDSYNTATTIISFNSTHALFDDNGGIINPNSLLFSGYWGRKRVAELLPVDYKPSQNSASNYAIYSKLSNYADQHITEKAYLHFDKPYYATGDTIYFKAYVTMGERLDLSQLSGILHVDLIGTTNKTEQSLKLPLANGLGWGDFALPDTLPKGNYRIRAYTQWQRNEGNYFEQTIPVGSVHNQKVPESSTARSKAVNAKADIQFFAEGGNLINGIRSKIALKAVGINGLGIGAKGVVIDNSGREVTSFASTHLGMGYFYLEPEASKTYKANITFADGTQNTIDLPLADVKGIDLSINNDSLPKATVKIEASPVYFKENKGKDYALLIYSGGFATTVTVKLDSILTTLEILKRHLHTGITRVTLFSQTNEPLCERLMFVQNFDQLNLNLNSDKQFYSSRGKVSMKLNAKNRADSTVMGHFSVSVVDENKVPVDENTETTILTDLLLTSDLKGTVEQPNYYFTSITEEKLKNLDLVMLTHGYRKFEWKQVMADSYPPLAWQPEKSLQISGTAENLFGKPLAKAPVALISFQPKSLTNTIADDKGHFFFDNLLFTDSIKLILQASNAKGKKYTKLVYNEDKPLSITNLTTSTQADINVVIPSGYLENNEKQQEELNKLGLGKGKILKEVKIRGIKADDKYETQSLAGAGHADQVLHSKDIGYGPSLSTLLNGKLHGIGFSGGTPFIQGMGAYSRAMLIVVDGVELVSNPGDPPPNIDGINPGDVETVEVLKYASASIYGMAGGNGVIIITTKKGGGVNPKNIASVGILPITVQGYYKAREFYSPKYESNITSNHPDLRSTIYWQPELVTDKDGNASFDYYNADGTGNYRVVIEGIDEKGNIGRQVYRYKVN
ncbi:carboxypeptidase-like regulatory domain-containing protein [Mucilaginibacter sp. McL0603]|uniref:carboxypeptidase-like regulatory domain-containing protein n=1 Tax=Mucilaginibacter sp. McL0603 TaxID=3415670 RepID=UPI003CEE5F28